MGRTVPNGSSAGPAGDQGRVLSGTITQPVTLAAQILRTAENRLEAIATATIQRADFKPNIPQIPRVAGACEAVALEVGFLALAQ